MSEPAFSKIAIIGIGLIGASIALAVKHRGIRSKIAVYDSDDDARDKAHLRRRAGEFSSKAHPQQPHTTGVGRALRAVQQQLPA